MPSVINTPRAVLLDWDDHLIDSEGYYDRTSELAFEKMRTDHGYNEPAIPLKERGLQTRTDYFAEQYGPKSVDLFMRLREDILMDHKQPAPTLRPGATELLRFLELNRIPYAIASDTPQARLENNVSRTLQAANLTIPIMVGTSDTIPLKPSPDIALEALKQLSEKTGATIHPSKAVLMCGDLVEKDGVLAQNAGIDHAITPREYTGDITGWRTFVSLNALTANLAQTVGKELQRPNYFKRFDYAEKSITREATEFIASERYYFIESPYTGELKPIEDTYVHDMVAGEFTGHKEYSDAEKALHQHRWIAKKARNLDGSGEYSPEQQMEAAYKVVEELLTPEMLDTMMEKTVAAVNKRRAETGDYDSKITIHLPHTVVIPPNPRRNVMCMGYLMKLTKYLNEMAREHHPELNIEFSDQERELIGLSMNKLVERQEGTNSLEIETLSGHRMDSLTVLSRSTSNLLGRLIQQPVFDYSTFKAGDMVLLADDHVQSGASSVTWYQELISRGVNVYALTTLSRMPENANLQGHEDISEDVEHSLNYAVDNYLNEHTGADRDDVLEKFTDAIDEMLGKVGLSITTLTNREALTLISHFIDGSYSDQLKWFESIAQKYKADLYIVERKDESLLEQAKKPSIPPMELLDEIERRIPKYTVRHLSATGSD